MDGTAVAIAGGRVVAIGSDADLEPLVGPATTVRDVGGAAILPALIDSHTHFHRASLVRRLFLDFERLAPASIADVQGHVAERHAALPASAWVQGDSLAASRLAERRWPDRTDLEAAAPGRAVVLRGLGKHVVVASSAALQAAGIDRTTPDPPGGRIERDTDGEPTGVLHERAKLRLDTSAPDTVVPAPTRGERLAALRAALPDLHRLGITTIHEMIRLPEEADDLAALHASGELPIRVRLLYRVVESPIRLEHLATLGIRADLGDDRYRVAGVKVSVDGWCIFGNAAVYEPYLGGERGILRVEPAELCRIVDAANARGLQVSVHAVGPRAVDAALDAFEAAGPASVPPYRLEHGHLDMDEARLARMRALDVWWSVQPALLAAYRDDWEAVLEPERVQAILPLAAAGRLGIPVLYNSDVPTGPQDPFLAIRAAVTRDSGGGRPIGPDERVDPVTAWRAWTELPARAARDDGLGHLRPGALGDAIVVAPDPLDPAGGRHAHGNPLDPDLVLTVHDGRVVHEADR